MKVITDAKPARRVFRIVDRSDDVGDDARHPLALLNDQNESVEIGKSPHQLATRAFELGADDVSHDYDHVKAAAR